MAGGLGERLGFARAGLGRGGWGVCLVRNVWLGSMFGEECLVRGVGAGEYVW
jgi:hypothetical protein